MLSRFRMVEKKQEGTYFTPPPPGKIGLNKYAYPILGPP